MSIRRRDPSQSQLFGEPEWLGFRHDGYDVLPLDRYITIREENRPSSRGGTDETRRRALAASTQSLLTFGLVEAVIEERVPETMLVRKNESGRLVMTTESLVEIVRVWIDRIKRSREDVLGPWLDRVHTNLRKAHSLMMEFTKSQFTVFKPLGDDAPAMVCLIAMIGEALVNAKMVFPPGLPQRGFSWSMVWIPHYRDLLRREMVADGWCPFTTEYLVSTCSVSSLKYASECGPTEDGKQHYDCSAKSCKTYDVDIKNYTPKHAMPCKPSHTSSGAACKYSKASLDRVVQYIDEGEIPVITLVTGADEGSVRLDVHRASEAPYVAISHVWADGLGSTTEVGLPICQLRRLSSFASELRPGTAFWTDGICVPEADKARKKAIGMMACTYREADAVLVLDGGLQLCHAAEPPGVKILRVFTSGWMRRLWTLQEALLAKKLRFLFADAWLMLTDLLPHPDDMLLYPHLTDLAGDLFRLTKQSSYGAYSIGDVARSLRWRSTNRPSDETLAIASILGVQASVLVDLNPEQRMMQLIRDVGKLPRNILFLSGPKLQVPGFYWAPTSFMAAHGGSVGGLEMSTQAVDAVWTPLGLEATYNALIFQKRTVEGGKPWKLRDEKADRLYEVYNMSADAGSYQCDILLFAETIPVGNASACAGVLRRPRPPGVEADGSFTVFCEYQRRLLISAVANPDLTGDAVTLHMSGKLRACVG